MPRSNDSLRRLVKLAVDFRDQRNWAQFHNAKELAVSLMVESAELLEHMQWWKPDQLAQAIARKKQPITEELADVLFSVLLLAHELDVDLAEAFEKKLKKIGQKYPVEKSRGKANKYTEL